MKPAMLTFGTLILCVIWYVFAYATVNATTPEDKVQFERYLRTLCFITACVIAFIMGVLL
jgi:hypothetical protein